jgi:hypothetical protein
MRSYLLSPLSCPYQKKIKDRIPVRASKVSGGGGEEEEEDEHRSFISSRLGTCKFRVNIRDPSSSSKSGGYRVLRVPYLKSPHLLFNNAAQNSTVLHLSKEDPARFHSPKKTISTSGFLTVYSFGKSPSKDLQNINSALKRRKL